MAFLPLAGVGRCVHLSQMDTRAEQLRWLSRVVSETGIAPTTLATKAGLAPTTLTRFLNNPDHATALSARTISAVENATGISYGAAIRPRLYRPQEAESYALDQSGPLAARIQAMLNGSNLNAWTLKTRALETVGFVPGDIVVVDLGEPALPGDAVCAQIYDAKAMRAETVFRLYEPPFLHAATFDRLQSAPILIDGNVGIKGPVIMSIRPRLARREAA